MGTGVTVAGIVVCSKTIQHMCCNCQSFIVSHNIFNSVEHFDNFWNCNIPTDQDRLVTNGQEDTAKRNVFQKVTSKMLGFLAHLQFKTPVKAVLPTPKKHPKQTIIEAELLLNRYQIEIVYSKENRVFLTGSYGVGKTIIIYKKIEMLQKSLKDKEVIYYVNFEEKSHLDSDFRIKMKPCEKGKVIKGGFSLSHIIKRSILPKEKENGTKSIHLMVDEYDTESLSSREASELTEIFTNQTQFKNSTIFIAAQAMETHHIDYDTGSEVKPMLSELKKLMHVYSLKYVMRTTVEIYTLAAITQNYLHGKLSDTIKETHRRFIKKNCEGKRTKTRDKYHYCLDSKIGHNICGPLPQLIKMPTTSIEQYEEIALIAFFLSTVVGLDKRHIAIVYYSSKTPPWLEQLFHLTIFQGLNITTDPAKFLNLDLDQANSRRNLVLVTNYRCIKGLEFSDVLLLLDVEEVHNQQFIPEVMTRCMSNLYVMLKPPLKYSCHIKDLLDEWETINSTCSKSPILETVELSFCSNRICLTQASEYCQDGNRIYVHKFSKIYEDLYKEIQGSDIPNFQSNKMEEKEKASSL